jgi:hypothetical protein
MRARNCAGEATSSAEMAKLPSSSTLPRPSAEPYSSERAPAEKGEETGVSPGHAAWCRHCQRRRRQPELAAWEAAFYFFANLPSIQILKFMSRAMCPSEHSTKVIT